MIDLNAFPGYPLCQFCKDTGITFDEYRAYRFCTCAAGVKRWQEEPNAVYEANEALRKLREKGLAG